MKIFKEVFQIQKTIFVFILFSFLAMSYPLSLLSDEKTQVDNSQLNTRGVQGGPFLIAQSNEMPEGTRNLEGLDRGNTTDKKNPIEEQINRKNQENKVPTHPPHGGAIVYPNQGKKSLPHREQSPDNNLNVPASKNSRP